MAVVKNGSASHRQLVDVFFKYFTIHIYLNKVKLSFTCCRYFTCLSTSVNASLNYAKSISCVGTRKTAEAILTQNARNQHTGLSTNLQPITSLFSRVQTVFCDSLIERVLNSRSFSFLLVVKKEQTKPEKKPDKSKRAQKRQNDESIMAKILFMSLCMSPHVSFS